MKNETLAEIGDRLAKARKDRGMKQEELASRAGLSPKTISAAENGQKALRPENIIKLCQILSLSTDYLLTGKLPGLNDTFAASKVDGMTKKQREALWRIIDSFLSICE